MLARRIIEQEELFRVGQYEMLNINVPDFPYEGIKGLRTASVGRRIYEGKMWERRIRVVTVTFGLARRLRHEQIPGSDCVVLYEGFATLSVLRADLYAKESTHRINEQMSRFDLFR